MKYVIGTKSKSKYAMKLVPALLVVLLLQGCAKETYDLSKLKSNWNPRFAIPLGHADLTAADILDSIGSKALVVDGSGFITLIYKGNLLSKTPEDFITMPPTQVLKQTINLTSSEVSAYNSASIGSVYSANKSITSTFNFSSGVTAQVDSIVFKRALPVRATP